MSKKPFLFVQKANKTKKRQIFAPEIDSPYLWNGLRLHHHRCGLSRLHPWLIARAKIPHIVLLIEAGGKDWRPEIHIPAAYSRLHHTPMDWAYSTVPQPGVNNRIMHQPRGKALGGSSSTYSIAWLMCGEISSIMMNGLN
ncbi:MAG: GMC family oxidoreductase N-terminal domain-containing protein [Bacteroidia bacterium]